MAKLETGVAAVIQSNWKEGCLVKFNYMSRKDKHIYHANDENNAQLRNILKILLEKKLPLKEKLEDSIKKQSLEIVKSKKIDIENMGNQDLDKFIFKVLEGDKILNIVNAVESKDIQEWNEKIQNILINILNLEETDIFFRAEIANSIVRENTLRNPEYLEFYKQWDEFLKEGRVR